MRKIAVACSKGGVGKTTTAVNLAAGLALAGRTVLLVEADALGHVGFALGIEAEMGLTEVVLGEVRPEEAPTKARERLWVLPGGPAVESVKNVLSRRRCGSHKIVAEALAPLDGRYDYVILDTSAGWDRLTRATLAYAEEILLPVSMEAMAIQTLLEFLRAVADVQSYKKLILRYVVPTFFDGRVKKSEVLLGMLKRYYGERMCSPISYNVKLSEAPALGKTIYEYAPKSRGAVDYARLTECVARDG